MSVQRVIDNKKIGANIRLARVKKMMSQSELAKLLGVTQTHMSNLERGRCGITVTMLNQLTNLFEVETDALLYGTPAIRPKAETVEVTDGIENYTLGDLIKAAKLLNGQ
ncbi:MAG: hypothetical protein DBY32_09505 [Phascolarctobacterium sp.]|nr:MAG: hypothetical protein DBY32_09505 [Phascolarctobacterium sp.]